MNYLDTINYIQYKHRLRPTFKANVHISKDKTLDRNEMNQAIAKRQDRHICKPAFSYEG